MVPPPSPPLPSPTPFQDLNLFPNAKLEPKPEPVDGCGSQLEPLGPTEPLPLSLPPPDASPEEAALLLDYFRRSHLFAADDDRGRHCSIVPAPVAPACSSAIVAAKKRKARSAEMVRVSSIGPRDRLYFRGLVRRTRITYDSLRALLLLRDEDRGEAFLREEAFVAACGRRSRPDLRAAALMTDRDLWLNRDRRIIGSIPGISVGDVFFFRMELCVVGLHGQVQAGIDYVPASRSASGEPVATSIIVSGGYEDDDDKGVVLIYTGHGGRSQNMQRHCVNQKLEGGNLALERSMNYGIEIRVIRGIKFDGSPSGRVYVYDGLYKIVDCWMDVGKSGFAVYKYKFLRMEGQEEMGSEILKLADKLKANPLSVRPVGYLSLDISRGRENLPVSIFNDIDDDRDPLMFEYLTRPILPPEAFQGKVKADDGIGCDCTLNCSAGCYCAKKNGGDFAYNRDGILLRGKSLIYECGTLCRCPPTCPNRVSQKGVSHRLEVFRSKETGWGVRSLDLIRAGTFICEFSGIAITKEQAEVLSRNNECLVNPVLANLPVEDCARLSNLTFSLIVTRGSLP
ncbi:SRA [Musa troglodytarum]|uniref:SRA n=1 Tax=Musa troglodytarum TaxID=320322 RepID=A0A9E7FGL2_9LILI|nr:SRA [Musa troglodytarum]